MLTPFDHALLETLGFLKALNRDATRPETAMSRIQALRRQHPDLDLQLLWDEQAYDASVHYDILIRDHGTGTVSLGLCPEQALPWPMRGVQRWSDQDLLRVNDTTLKVSEGMAIVDFMWDEQPILRHLVHACLIREALDQDPIEVSDGEVQRAMDGFRRAHKLFTADDTYRWLTERGISLAQLELRVANAAAIAKLRRRVTADQVDTYFEAHAADFDVAHVVTLDCGDQAAAVKIIERVDAGLDLYAAAEAAFVAGAAGVADPADAPSPLRFERIRRGDCPAALAQAVFAARPGEVVGPVVSPGRCRVVRVLALRPACLDAPTREAVQHQLFEAWLSQRRQGARIVWNWGRADQTAGGAGSGLG